MGLFLILGHAFAQNRTISGTVLDDKGTPIPNASILIKGSRAGTTSDENGKFQISVPPTARVLVASAVGMANAEITIGSSNNVNFVLQSASASMEEVVVVGYGIQQKTSFTGAASKIDPKQFSNLITPSIDKQLAGRAPGVQVTNVGGSVNTPARIRIRGTNSINQSNDPLIVVDGVPVISGNLGATSNTNALGDINPSDIENIEVLKDGSATAIFGSRGAGGVIMITTKRGIKGKAKVSYDGFYGLSSALKRFDLLNAREFVTIQNEKFTNAGQTPRANFGPLEIDTDWQSVAMIDNAPAHNHTVSIQGGSDKTVYYLSLNYSDQKGIIFSNTNRSIRIRTNIEHEASKFLKIGNNLTLSRQFDTDQNNGANALGGSIAATLRLLPNVSPYSGTHPSGYNINFPAGNSMNGSPNTTSVDDNFSNVAFTLNENRYSSEKYRMLNNTYVEVSPLKNLKFKSVLGLDVLTDYSYQGLSNLHGDGYGTSTGGTNGLTYNASQLFNRLVWQNYVNYNQSFGEHGLYVTIGHELQQDKTRFTTATGTNISDNFYINGENLITNTATIQTIGGSVGESGFESLFGRLNYDYKNKYFAQASFRRDGQSSLAPSNRYGVFPGFSAGWRFTEEGFWANNPNLSRIISEGKLKASYAKVGNPLGGFPFLSTFGSRPYGNISGISLATIGNPALQWETSTKYDIGVELSLFDNRFTLAADWFLNDVNDLVFAVPTPLSAGIPGNSISQNIASLRNKGVEIILSGNVLKSGDFSWDASFNYSNVKNRVTSLYTVGEDPVQFVQNGNYNIIRVGDPLNIIYGNVWAGVNTANGNPMYLKADGTLIQHNFSPGATIGGYFIANGKDDGTRGAASSLVFADRTNLGVAVPIWFGALTNTFTYKGFMLDVMLRYSGGNKIMNVTRQEALLNQSFQNNGKEILSRWNTPGQVTNVPRLYYGQGNNINQTTVANSRFVESGDYLRLQNVVLSYDLDRNLLNRISNGGLSSARFFVQGQNLFVLTKYTGADPDNISAGGIDNAVSPQVRTISFGLSLGF